MRKVNLAVVGATGMVGRTFLKVLEEKQLPTDIDYKTISGLRLEAQEKLNKYRPLNIGQAGRISVVNPADVSVLLIWLSGRKHGEN